MPSAIFIPNALTDEELTDADEHGGIDPFDCLIFDTDDSDSDENTAKNFIHPSKHKAKTKKGDVQLQNTENCSVVSYLDCYYDEFSILDEPTASTISTQMCTADESAEDATINTLEVYQLDTEDITFY